MQKSGRALRLNIVLPDRDMAEEGSYNFRSLLGIVRNAERPATRKGGSDLDRRGFLGTTDITVNYMVRLAAPVADSKKLFRARIDRSQTVRGEGRVSLMRSLAPVLFRPELSYPPGTLQPPQTPLRQFDDDLAYMKWNFGGVTLGDPPSGEADRERVKVLKDNFELEALTLRGMAGGGSGVRGPADVRPPPGGNPAGFWAGDRAGGRAGCAGAGLCFPRAVQGKKADAVTGQARWCVSGSVRGRLSHTRGKAAGIENSSSAVLHWFWRAP